MSSTLGSIRGIAQSLILIVAALALASGAANAQFPGYGWGYGFPAYGYGAYASPFGYGMAGYGYGMPGYGYPGMAYGYGYGMAGYGYGMPGYGYPGMGYGYADRPAIGYASPITASPYMNPLFGVGLTPLGVQSYLTEANLLGRGQLEADRRARARDLQRLRGR